MLGLSRSARSTSAFNAFEWNSAHQSAGSLLPISSRCVFPPALLSAGCRSGVNAAISGAAGSAKSGPTQDGSAKQAARPAAQPVLRAAFRQATARNLSVAIDAPAPLL